MAAFNVVLACMDAGRMDLVDDVYLDLVALVDLDPTNRIALVEQAKCAHVLIDTYIDRDLARAAAIAAAARTALTSPSYLETLPQFLGDTDLEIYLRWVDEIIEAIDSPSQQMNRHLGRLQTIMTFLNHFGPGSWLYRHGSVSESADGAPVLEARVAPAGPT